MQTSFRAGPLSHTDGACARGTSSWCGPKNGAAWSPQQTLPCDAYDLAYRDNRTHAIKYVAFRLCWALSTTSMSVGYGMPRDRQLTDRLACLRGAGTAGSCYTAASDLSCAAVRRTLMAAIWAPFFSRVPAMIVADRLNPRDRSGQRPLRFCRQVVAGNVRPVPATRRPGGVVRVHQGTKTL